MTLVSKIQILHVTLLNFPKLKISIIIISILHQIFEPALNTELVYVAFIMIIIQDIV